jgi:serine protease Do
MDGLRFKPNKTSSCSCIILTFFLLVLLIGPSLAFTQGDNGVATLRQIGRIFAGIAEKASPAVVTLTVEKSTRRKQPGAKPWWKIGPGDNILVQPLESSDDFWLYPDPLNPRPRLRIPTPHQQSQGLGFIVSEDGHILTNHHIVDGARKIKAKLADGRDLTARIIGLDPETDVAVIKIDADDLPVLELGDSNALKVGDWVVGIGNPLGLGRTFTAGLVTAKGRSGLGLATFEDFVQTSINLHLGDGGGPLLDLDGNVVGINTAIVGIGRGSGISLAIPVNIAKVVYKQLTESGTIERGFLGVLPQDIDVKMAEALGLETAEGVIISKVVKNSAADKAGIKNNDIIVEFNGKPLESARQLLHRVAALKPGKEVNVVVLRDGKREVLAVTLDQRPPIQDRISDDNFNAP